MQAILAQIDGRLGDVAANLERHRAVVAEAWAQGHELVVFPELSLTGRLLWDEIPAVARSAAEVADGFAGLAPGLGRGLEVVVGFVERGSQGRCYNSAALVRLAPDGVPRLIAVHRKVRLTASGPCHEPAGLTAGGDLRAFETDALGRAGLLIGEDLGVPAAAFILAVDGPRREGARALLSVAAAPAEGLTDVVGATVANVVAQHQRLREAARQQGLLVLHCQRVGVEEGLIYPGGSVVVAPTGELLAEAALFDEELLSVDLAVNELLKWQPGRLVANPAAEVDLLRRELARIVAEEGR